MGMLAVELNIVSFCAQELTEAQQTGKSVQHNKKIKVFVNSNTNTYLVTMLLFILKLIVSTREHKQLSEFVLTYGLSKTVCSAQN